MQVFVLRHGEAVSRAETDSARELTPSGRKDVAEVVTRNLDSLATVEHIYVSPYVRAQQTAAIARQLIEQHSGRSLSSETSALLTPDCDHRQVLGLLESCGAGQVLIVSHQPLVGTLIDWLADLEPGRYRMGTSGLASISLDVLAPRCGQFNWLHHPCD